MVLVQSILTSVASWQYMFSEWYLRFNVFPTRISSLSSIILPSRLPRAPPVTYFLSSLDTILYSEPLFVITVIYIMHTSKNIRICDLICFYYTILYVYFQVVFDNFVLFIINASIFIIFSTLSILKLHLHIIQLVT